VPLLHYTTTVHYYTFTCCTTFHLRFPHYISTVTHTTPLRCLLLAGSTRVDTLLPAVVILYPHIPTTLTTSTIHIHHSLVHVLVLLIICYSLVTCHCSFITVVLGLTLPPSLHTDYHLCRFPAYDLPPHTTTTTIVTGPFTIPHWDVPVDWGYRAVCYVQPIRHLPVEHYTTARCHSTVPPPVSGAHYRDVPLPICSQYTTLLPTFTGGPGVTAYNTTVDFHSDADSIPPC